MDTRYYFNDAVRAIGALNELALHTSRPYVNIEDYYYTIVVDFLAEYGHRNELLFVKETVEYTLNGTSLEVISREKEILGVYGKYTEIGWREVCFDIQREAERLASDSDKYDPCVYAENQAELKKFYDTVPKEKIFKNYEKRGAFLKKIDPVSFDPQAISEKFYGEV